MNFCISKLILWLSNGEQRILEFMPNKVNVITGDSETGKTAIFEIIDYILFSSETKISEEEINEYVDWYGMHFSIGSKELTLARKKFDAFRKVSQDYYFSGSGVIPKSPEKNIQEKLLKKIIESEFSISSDTIIPYGGKHIRAGSKISLRYFLLFNSQSGDTISHSEQFFDKMAEPKYREALERVFDLATGIESVENILIKEKIDNLQREINKLENRKKSQELDMESSNLEDMIAKAKEFNLIPENNKTYEEDLFDLQLVSKDFNAQKVTTELNDLEEIRMERISIARRIKIIQKYKQDYTKYKESEADNLDSLRPIQYLKENFLELIESPDVRQFILSLDKEYRSLKKSLRKRTPIEQNLDDELQELQIRFDELEKIILRYPQSNPGSTSLLEKILFIAEVRGRLNSVTSKKLDTSVDQQILSIIEDQKELKEKYIDRDEARSRVLLLLNELIQKYLDKASDEGALDTYNRYRSSFDYKGKRLQLRKPNTLVPSHVGSSSNHLFMHICLFLGLHELMVIQQIPYVPRFLLLDQPSRPYYGEAKREIRGSEASWEDIKNDDREKITTVFRLLNHFIDEINKHGVNFQMIVLEHIPENVWTEAKLENIVLVEEFRKNGNKLINL
ncbi:AAA domain-containing protein [Tumebacillus sp. BK434]|uniref:DUF3732 domain-containing protein n=1 Tax=Tumebacillus sp. BK434 TaxID=2512169 RepID=UPI0010469839|nr:DUF3732 domain-containing protein [Tumebacillus sp. BK434]TCP54442.1 AAA domain-containing protein [Tumebacillus sp. BK434]